MQELDKLTQPDEQAMHQVHDKFFRTVMKNKRVARAFLEAHLPTEILKIIDLNHLDLQPRSYINDVRKETAVDVLFKTQMDGKDALLYLLVEHQSSPDKLMPFRLLKYLVNVIDDYVVQNKQETLPLVYPIVVYHADKPWPYSTDIRDIVDAPRELIDRYFLQPFHLVDLGKIDDQELKQHAWASITEFALKHIFARDLLPHVQEIATIMRHIVQEGGGKYVEIVLEYIMNRGELSSRDKYIELINKEISLGIGNNIMSLAERIKTEAKLEGKLEGIHTAAIVLSMLSRGEDVQTISNKTGLAIGEIELLKQSTLH